MELYLIRHADAVPLGEQGVTTDEERPLTEKGNAQSESAAKALAARGVALDKIYTSPLVRARQTAEILMRVWSKPELTLETCDLLAPGGRLRKLSKYLMKSGGAKIGLVGHMPDLSEFAGWLLGDKKMQLDFAKAGVACIVCGELPAKGMGTLEWLVTPEWY
ncbi:MAG: phosphohistidine phosphatase SixA [Planctomycetes bacterium]|nr:phosphohistidine phosphatase SixA [Planctomycetota bacterium]